MCLVGHRGSPSADRAAYALRVIETGRDIGHVLWLTAGISVGDVTLTKLAPHLRRVEHTDVWVPAYFSARFEREPIVEIDVRYRQHYAFKCRAVSVRARGAASVTPGAFRDVRVDELVLEAAERSAYIARELTTELLELARAWLTAQSENPEVATQLKLGDRFTFPAAVPFLLLDRADYEAFFGTHLRQFLSRANHATSRSVSHLDVAREYNRAAAAGEEVIEALVEKFHWKRQHAKNRIRDARLAGYLPATGPGQPAAFPPSQAQSGHADSSAPPP